MKGDPPPATSDPEHRAELPASHPNDGSRLEIWKLLVEMADRVSQRRQSANSFYLSVNTLLIGGSAYLAEKQSLVSNVLLAVAGGGISALWLMNIDSYRTLNAAKFVVIHEVEQGLPLQPFAREWQELDPKKVGERHRPFHTVERLVPFVFIGLYLAQVARVLPWARLAAWAGFHLT